MTRVYNFNAGPAVLPLEVLQKAASELVEYGSTGMSVMEMSHRSKDFEAILDHTQATLRELMGIPSNYRIMFLQGGASTQFAMVPMNLFRKSLTCDMIDTGFWTQRAIEDAQRYGKVRVIASSKEQNYNHIPDVNPRDFNPEADYFYICTNNTIYGTRYTSFPETGKVPLIADMSSNIMSERIDVSCFGMIFAGAQKNIGPSGLTLVIMREDLIGPAMECTPTMLRYSTHSDNNSLYNTPPTYAVYMAGLVFDHMKSIGGIAAIEKTNHEKAGLLYNYIDESKLFISHINKKDRSLMNVPFSTCKPDLDEKFVKESTAAGLIGLKGHRKTGGMRASMYNAMTLDGVRALVDFMKKFESTYR